MRLVLARLSQQSSAPHEVVVDNESDDESRRYIAEFGAKLVHLPKGSFTYGRATNIGFENCTGDLVLMLSSHSIPIGKHFIDDACEPFSDLRVAAVRIPIAANTSELRKLYAFAPLDQNSSPEEVFRRAPVASGSVIRRQVWEQHRFNEQIQAAEDKEWALRVLRTGQYVMTVADACYCYARNFSKDSWLRKIRKEETAGSEAAGILPNASLKDVIARVLVSQREVFRTLSVESQLYFFRQNLRRHGSAAAARKADQST